MYSILLATHSLLRWLVLTSLLYSIFLAYRGWLLKKPYSKVDDLVRSATTTIVHIQLVIGVWLYCISPVVHYFLHNYSEGVHNRQIRFFGMEHISMMVIAVTVFTVGSSKARRKTVDREKFKTMAIWFTVALLIILSSIPWSFSPLISRPNFRPF
jgi:cell division protein FtsW (lipid II flippase)